MLWIGLVAATTLLGVGILAWKVFGRDVQDLGVVSRQWVDMYRSSQLQDRVQ